jgi:ElaB/YqjD/DUF883 family membrane-anchored ribosome-binding protein
MANKKKSNEKTGIRQRTHDGVDKVMDKAQSMSDTGKDAMNRSKERAIIMRKDVDGYIGENPEKSILIAMGFGLVVGAILVSVMRRNR